METATYVYCNWTLLDMIGRFAMFCLWGYYMGKSVTHPAKTTWVLTFAGVLLCAVIHTGMQNPASANTSGEPVYYFIKVFLFYLTASIIGYRAGQQTAEKTRAYLNRIQDALNRWEAEKLHAKKEHK